MPEAFAAADRIHGNGVRHTRLLPSPWVAQQCGAEQVFLKLENEQVTGSFKPRGAVNKVHEFNMLNRPIVRCIGFAEAILRRY